MKNLSSVFITGSIVSTVLFMNGSIDLNIGNQSDYKLYEATVIEETLNDEEDLISMNNLYAYEIENLDINEIQYIEEEEEIEVGFYSNQKIEDTYSFGPLQVEITDLNEIEYIEDEEEMVLGFDTKDYLPEGFDPYQEVEDINNFGPLPIEISNLNEIEYIEEEEEIVLGFDTRDYLPEGFDPYRGVIQMHHIQ